MTPAQQLEDLAHEVQRHGLHTVLLAPPGRPRRLRVTTSARQITEEIELTDAGLRWAWGDQLTGSTTSEQAATVEAYFASVP